MNVHVFSGARADSLLGYLKALAVLRLLSVGPDRDARAVWKDDTLELHTNIVREDVERYFLDGYTPTPIVNPWNNGAGFDGKSRAQTAGKTLDQVLATTSERWRPYRTAIATGFAVVNDATTFGGTDKSAILGTLRDRFSDEALLWLDAAVVVGNSVLGFPWLLGSGGNDGRLDFSINFAARAVDVIGDGCDRDRSAKWLRDALDDTSLEPRIGDAAIGQFAPGATGGPNATTGYSAVSLVNPWDFVLLLEGTIAFAGSIGKRFEGSNERASFPFMFQASASGFGSSSASEETRGEIWLPLWRGAATYPSVLALLRAGRLEIDVNSGARTSEQRATSAIEAAQAALSAGVASGIDKFSRVVFAQRNGLAYSATPAGTVTVHGDAAMGLLTKKTLRWLTQIRRHADAKGFGPSARAALKRYDDAIFAYGNRSGRIGVAHALQDAIASLAELDFALASNPPKTTIPLSPLPFLDRELYVALDDGSAEHRIACALASYGFHATNPRERLRYDIEHVGEELGSLSYAPRRVVEWSSDLIASLGRILERRVRRAIGEPGKALDPGHGKALEFGHGVDIQDLEQVLEGSIALARLRRLIMGYAMIEPTNRVFAASADERPATVPATFAALKLIVDGRPAGRGLKRPALDPEVVPLLIARRSRAFGLLESRLRAADFPVRSIRGGSLHGQTGPLYAAAALVPISAHCRDSLRTLALLATSSRRGDR